MVHHYPLPSNAGSTLLGKWFLSNIRNQFNDATLKLVNQETLCRGYHTIADLFLLLTGPEVSSLTLFHLRQNTHTLWAMYTMVTWQSLRECESRICWHSWMRFLQFLPFSSEFCCCSDTSILHCLQVPLPITCKHFFYFFLYHQSRISILYKPFNIQEGQ